MSKEKLDFKNMSVNELASKADELRRELFSLRLHAATSSVKDNTKFKKLRKDIARSLTFLNQKLIVQD